MFANQFYIKCIYLLDVSVFEMCLLWVCNLSLWMLHVLTGRGLWNHSSHRFWNRPFLQREDSTPSRAVLHRRGTRGWRERMWNIRFISQRVFFLSQGFLWCVSWPCTALNIFYLPVYIIVVSFWLCCYSLRKKSSMKVKRR